MIYDFAIIGAGPAGLCAAAGLIKNNPDLKIVVIDKGNGIRNRPCTKNDGPCTCKPCNMLCGIGGAGGKSDGKLLFNPPTDGDMYELASKAEVFKYIGIVEKFFKKAMGIIDIQAEHTDKSHLELMCTINGLKFIPYRELHIGSDALVDVIDRIHSDLVNAGVEFRTRSTLTPGTAKKIIIAVGRYGSEYIRTFIECGYVSSVPKPVDIGVRLETLNDITKHITDVQYDFKIINRYKDFMVRSYCVNPGGFVANERHEGFNLVNGHSERNRKSENCNFAVLFKAELTKPSSDTAAYARNIAKVFDDLGDGQPIVQRLEDLYNCRRSTPNRIGRSYVTPTLSAVPGDLRWGFPAMVLDAIVDYIKRLDNIAPGIAHGYNTLLYAPEIKFQCTKLVIDENFASLDNKDYYFIGDCSGYTGSIVSAAAMGFMLADRIEPVKIN